MCSHSQPGEAFGAPIGADPYLSGGITLVQKLGKVYDDDVVPSIASSVNDGRLCRPLIWTASHSRPLCACRVGGCADSGAGRYFGTLALGGQASPPTVVRDGAGAKYGPRRRAETAAVSSLRNWVCAGAVSPSGGGSAVRIWRHMAALVGCGGAGVVPARLAPPDHRAALQATADAPGRLLGLNRIATCVPG